MELIVADTSCLIVYQNINQIDILQHTFLNLTVTVDVAEEFGELPDWISVKTLTKRNHYTRLSRYLGKGEASSIALAFETNGSLLVIDEKKRKESSLGFGIEYNWVTWSSYKGKRKRGD